VRVSERESDTRGGALVLQRGGGGRVARRTPNSPSVAQACRVSATRREGDGAHKKTKGKTVGWRSFLKIKLGNNF
jgi:hypothetical protein